MRATLAFNGLIRGNNIGEKKSESLPSYFLGILLILNIIFYVMYIASKVSKYGVFSGPYFPVFGLNAEI